MSKANRNYTIEVWRQKGPKDKGQFKEYKLKDVSPDSSFLEMLDLLNLQLQKNNEEPIAFEHDCREGICGTCGVMIDGRPHGPLKGVTTCQLHMREFENNARILIEPFRANAFPVIKDLAVDRSSFDAIIQAGGYISVDTGSAPDANAIPIPKEKADEAFMSAACIGCGACVAACPNASASLFTSAKISHLGLLPQGDVQRHERVTNMVEEHDHQGFGHCTNIGACSQECPKGISLTNIAKMNREYFGALMPRMGKRS